MFDRSELLRAFLDELEEQLQLLDQDILQLEQYGESPELLKSIFRVAHTLKGSSAAMGFEEMKNVTHEMENVLDKIRHHLLPVSKPVVDLLFRCLDLLRQLRDEFIAGDIQTNTEPLIQDLRHLLETNEQTKGEKPSTPMEFFLQPEQKDQLHRAQKQGFNVWECAVTLEPDCEMKLARAYVILRDLEHWGKVVATRPKLEIGADPSRFGQVAFLLITDADVESVASYIGQMVDVKQVQIHPYPHSLDVHEERTGKTFHEEAGPKDLKKTNRPSQTIRVDVERLERLMNLVGELVIEQTRITQIVNVLHSHYSSDEMIDDLEQISNHVARVIGELQESVMKTRMLPIEQLFAQFPRMVRDLAQELEKEVHLVIEGQETELERTVIEEIRDPLIHLIRNALDHGIEKPEIRKQLHKPAKGTLRITACHQESQVVLMVEDDGAGIDPEKIKLWALRKEWITSQEAEGMTEREFIDLIFRPGFSTVQTATGVSGRGVGMDIVRTHIEKLNGIIEVNTRPGEGTKFIIKLPSTLAILTGLLIKLAGRTYALPMSSVLEIVRIPMKEIHSVKGQAVVVIREKAIPLIWMHDLFGIKRQKSNRKNMLIVIVGVAEKRLGLVVDELIGNQEIVVKSIGTYIGKIDGISGATILGDGNVALILDVMGISKMADNRKPDLQELI